GLIPPELLSSGVHQPHFSLFERTPAKRRRSDVSRIIRQTEPRTSQESGQELLHAFQQGDAAAMERFAALSASSASEPKLADALRVVAHEYGFPVGRS